MMDESLNWNLGMNMEKTRQSLSVLPSLYFSSFITGRAGFSSHRSGFTKHDKRMWDKTLAREKEDQVVGDR